MKKKQLNTAITDKTTPGSILKLKRTGWIIALLLLSLASV